DTVAYATARDLAWVVGTQLGRPGEGRVWLEHARAALVRSGGDPEREADIFERLGELENAEGHYAEALEAHERTLALREEQLGSEHPAVAESLLEVGALQGLLGDEQGLETLARARALAVLGLGEAHPTVATIDGWIGILLHGSGRLDESAVALRRALDLREQAFGPDEPGLANIITSLAAVQEARGELLEALLLHERATKILERTLGPEHSDTLSARANFAAAKAESGQVDEAIIMLRDAVAVAQRVLSPNEPIQSSL
ncbi:MAG: tetratricopeptide repeat protein, partial [Myxococcales bacterium]|nr:tetratricopeptide repeat protein [Myxococcales bacterium]